jgi:hypothetical protein
MNRKIKKRLAGKISFPEKTLAKEEGSRDIFQTKRYQFYKLLGRN